jgi:hypothetical protein
MVLTKTQLHDLQYLKSFEAKSIVVEKYATMRVVYSDATTDWKLTATFLTCYFTSLVLISYKMLSQAKTLCVSRVLLLVAY